MTSTHLNRVSLPDILTSWKQATELIFPRVCASCQTFGPSMLGAGALCPLCDQLVRLATLNLQTTTLPGNRLPVVSAGRYEHELGRCVLAYKDAGRTDLSPYLASALARALTCLLELSEGELEPAEPIYLVPLPSSRVSVRRRGYAPAPLLARAVLPLLCSPVPVKVADVLAQVPAWARVSPGQHRSKAQKTLGVEERYRQMQGKLRVGKPALHQLGRYYSLEGATCLLVDDVFTTGASLREGHRVLSHRGARVLGGATIAYVPKRQRYNTE
ncbi:ComF family protein [Rothia nasimurium]|uniref:ComF family protein n=1 Tax=Rothia nasimurium TaxID=85336 RepID=UPI001626B912|nr:ComF family protein [Rothia nasimurium]